MQQVTSRPQANPNIGSTNGGNSRSTIIVVLALLLFALSGLMTGFATGAFTRPKQTPQTQTNKSKPAAPPTAATHQQTPITNATATPEVTKLGLPYITQNTYSETADGATNYTLSAYPIDSVHGTQIHVGDITCKIWLTKDENATGTLLASQDKLRSLDTVSGVLPTEMAQALTFINTTPQTQLCSANGATSWTYTVSPNVDPGKYFLMVLADWKGNVYNWTARQIIVKKAS